MTELEKIAYAKSFIDKLANGINPIDGSEIPENDVVNNLRLSRCFFYVSDILRQVVENGGITPHAEPKEKQGRKSAYFLTPEQAAKFEFSDTPISTTEIVNKIIAVGPQYDVKRFPKRKLAKWLVCMNLIEEIEIDNIRVKRPTESGKELGIELGECEGRYGIYTTVFYNRDAQQFIIDNIEAIVNFDTREYKEKMSLDNQGKPWDIEQDEKLLSLYEEGLALRDIAREMKRGEMAIKIRLRRHGIDLGIIH